MLHIFIIMKTVSVEVESDHLERIAKGRKPVLALAELIWNALDADANRVSVFFAVDFSGGLSSIRVVDDGTGIIPRDAEVGFGRLGGSWKRTSGQTRRDHRMLHGKEGRGRFHAFSLGADVEWTSCYEMNGSLLRIRVSGSADHLKTFEISDPESDGCANTGTEVEITAIPESANALLTGDSRNELAEVFAFYLRQYPNIQITINGEAIDPAALELSREDLELGPVQAGDQAVLDAELTVIEWKRNTSRTLYLCDVSGFALHALNVGIQAPGFNFTAYLRSKYFRELYERNELLIGDLDAGISALHEAAKLELRDYFRRRAAAQANELMEEWKREKIYPYDGEADSPVEVTERQVFDVLAYNVSAYLPSFASSEKRNRQLSLRLLREALESNPDSMRRILADVLNLPKTQQDELAALLEKTSLSAIISSAKVVADRLDFLRGLEVLVFDPVSREELLERKQLHRIVADHTWIFGEQFNLSVDDQSLTEVLKKHLSLLGQEPTTLDPVTRSDGSSGIVDLMLSRSVGQNNSEEREHLIVELKRPKTLVTLDVLNQVTRYAMAVADDERFRETKTKWIFWAISNNMDSTARRQARQSGRPRGLAGSYDDPTVEIWIKTWGEVLEECRSRLHFYQEKLNYTADRTSALAYLKETHAKYFPPSLLTEIEDL